MVKNPPCNGDPLVAQWLRILPNGDCGFDPWSGRCHMPQGTQTHGLQLLWPTLQSPCSKTREATAVRNLSTVAGESLHTVTRTQHSENIMSKFKKRMAYVRLFKALISQIFVSIAVTFEFLQSTGGICNVLHMPIFCTDHSPGRVEGS